MPGREVAHLLLVETVNGQDRAVDPAEKIADRERDACCRSFLNPP